MNSTKSATLALWVTLTFLLGSGLLVMKNQVQTLENRLVSINKGIEDDIKTIHILQAEWSFELSVAAAQTCRKTYFAESGSG